jgi:hypothetical protein
MEWVAESGRQYKSNSEFNMREGVWASTDAFIQEVNSRGASSGQADPLVLKHNKFSDRTQQERDSMKGYGTSQNGKQSRQGRDLEASSEIHNELRGLRRSGEGRNWFAEGATGPVKDQGNCGSCYAFAGNTALEQAIYALTGSYNRLSEQEIIDCTHEDRDPWYWNAGCFGGYMTETWWYSRATYGAALHADYQYISGTNAEMDYSDPIDYEQKLNPSCKSS